MPFVPSRLRSRRIRHIRDLSKGMIDVVILFFISTIKFAML